MVEAKKRCYPKFETTEKGCFINLQDLVDKTTHRLLMTFEVTENELTLFWKWGQDSTSGFSIFNQKCSLSDIHEESILSVSFVPMYIINEIGHKVWQNERMCSCRYTRPCEIDFVKETAKVIIDKHNFYENEIKELQPTSCNGKMISHKFHCTMIDGKVINSITNKLLISLHLCGCTLSEIEKKKPQQNLSLKPST